MDIFNDCFEQIDNVEDLKNLGTTKRRLMVDEYFYVKRMIEKERPHWKVSHQVLSLENPDDDNVLASVFPCFEDPLLDNNSYLLLKKTTVLYNVDKCTLSYFSEGKPTELHSTYSNHFDCEFEEDKLLIDIQNLYQERWSDIPEKIDRLTDLNIRE